MTKITIPDDITPWLRDFASSSPDAELADLSVHAATRIEALEHALDEIIMEATSRNHAIDIARRARAEGGE